MKNFLIIIMTIAVIVCSVAYILHIIPHKPSTTLGLMFFCFVPASIYFIYEYYYDRKNKTFLWMAIISVLILTSQLVNFFNPYSWSNYVFLGLAILFFVIMFLKNVKASLKS